MDAPVECTAAFLCMDAPVECTAAFLCMDSPVECTEALGIHPFRFETEEDVSSRIHWSVKHVTRSHRPGGLLLLGVIWTISLIFN